jgi:putative MATE family efflux protein
MLMDSKSHLSEVSITRALFILGAPTIGTGLLHSAFNIIDMLFVGRLGPDALAAVSVSGVVIFLLITVAICVSIGTLSLVSRYWGGRHYRSAALVLGQSIYLSLFLSALFGVVGWYTAGPLLTILGARGDVLSMAVVYFRIISVGAAFIFVGVSFATALRASGDAVTPFKVMALAVALNTLLDPVLIFGLFGFPALGVAGSALATISSRAVAVLILGGLVIAKKSHFNLTGAFGSIRWPLMWHIIKIGFYSSMEMLTRSVSALIFLKIVAPFGTSVLAAFGIGTRLRMMALMPGIGLGYAAGVIVGQSLGAGNPKRARSTTWLSLLIYELLLVPVVGVFLIFPERIIGFFNHDPQVLHFGRQFIFYVALSMLFMAFMIILGKSLGGAGDTRGPMIVSVVCLIFVGVPLAYALSRTWGAEGVWIALLIASILQSVLIILWFERGKWVEQAKLELHR